jgi:iron complex outermembrane receptor protein
VLRGAYGTGFRAPTLSDLYQPLGTTFAGSFDDPVRCPVTGSDYDCHETSNYGVPYRSHIGGNPGLQPEKSRQWNVGVVWQPVAELSVSADYFRVEVRNLIQFASDVAIRDHFSALAPTQVVRKPPDANFPNLPGEIDYLILQSVNLGTLQTSGFDVDLRWRPPATSIGRFSASLNGTYVFDYKVAGLDPDAFPRSAGSRGPSGAISRWRHYATLDWSYGAWAATLASTLQSGYSEPCLELDVTGCATRRVGTYSVWDAQGRYTGLRNLTLTLGVRNLLDVAPPLSNQGSTFQAGYDPTYADPRGRMFYGAIRYAFQ